MRAVSALLARIGLPRARHGFAVAGPQRRSSCWSSGSGYRRRSAKRSSSGGCWDLGDAYAACRSGSPARRHEAFAAITIHTSVSGGGSSSSAFGRCTVASSSRSGDVTADASHARAEQRPSPISQCRALFPRAILRIAPSVGGCPMQSERPSRGKKSPNGSPARVLATSTRAPRTYRANREGFSEQLAYLNEQLAWRVPRRREVRRAPSEAREAHGERGASSCARPR